MTGVRVIASAHASGAARWRGGGPARLSPSPSGWCSASWCCVGSPTPSVSPRPSVCSCSTARWRRCLWRGARATSGCPSPSAGVSGAREAGVRCVAKRSVVAEAWARCARCRLLRADWRDMGVVHDRAGRTLTAAVALRGNSFALLGADEQDRRVGAWASVLSSSAREASPVHRVQWVAASFPDEGQGVRSYLAAEAAPDASSVSTASYESLLSDMDSHTCAHDVVLALQVRLTKSVEVGCAALAREVGSLVRLLADADVQVESVLTAADLARQLLRTYEPRNPLGERGVAAQRSVAHGDRRDLVDGARRRHGARRPSGWRSGRASRCGATSWRRSSWARPAAPSRS